jgi:hypothetical protein
MSLDFGFWILDFGLQMGLVFKNKTLEIRILSSPHEFDAPEERLCQR